MVNSYNNLPASTKLLIQSFLAVLGSVLVGVVAAAYQNYTQAGHLDVQALINICLLTFALLFGKAMHDWVPAHAQALLKAANDEKQRWYDAAQRSQNVANAVVATQGRQVQANSVAQPVQPHVVVQPAIAPALKPEEVQSIAAQLAVNLINIAADRASQTGAPATPAPVAPVAQPAPEPPAEPPYVDPLRNSAVLPAYTPPVAVPDQATQVVPQVPFTV